MPVEVILVVSAVAAVPFTGIALLLHLRREKRTDERLRQIEEEYRRREAALIRREAALIKTLRLLAGGPTTGPHPITRLYPVASGERR